MTDYSKLSDQELVAMYRQLKGGAKPAKLTPQEQAALTEQRNAAGQMREITAQADSFLELNRKAPTGPLYKIPGATTIGGLFKPEIAQMDALTARMAPSQRVPGSGTTSDKDLALFMKAVPSPDRLGTANQGIVKDMRGMAERKSAYVQFLDQYAAQNGTLNGAEAAYARRNAPKTKNVFAPKGRPPLDDIFR